MNRFAALLDRLAYEPGHNAKLRLVTEYLRLTPDPERGWALAALTGALSFAHAKPGIVRALIPCCSRCLMILWAICPRPSL
jgi:DNA ligase-1